MGWGLDFRQRKPRLLKECLRAIQNKECKTPWSDNPKQFPASSASTVLKKKKGPASGDAQGFHYRSSCSTQLLSTSNVKIKQPYAGYVVRPARSLTFGPSLGRVANIAPSSAPAAEIPDTKPTSKTSGGKDMETLMKMLSAASEGPAAEIQTGNPPVPPNVGITPVGDDPGILTSYCYLVELSALSALYTGIWELNTLKKRGREQPYNISIASEASQAFADLADAGFQTMIGSLAGSYNLSSAVSNSYTKQMRKTSLHFDFLDDLFKSFNLVSTAFTQLDGILSTFVSAV